MCKSPLARLETFERYTNQKGRISYRANFISWEEVERNPKYFKSLKYRRVDQIGCGKCIECRLNKSLDKAKQMIMEKKNYPEEECWFLTLTYSDEYLPFNVTVNTETGERIEGVSLQKKDAQNFIKKLRRYFEYHYNNKGIRYVIAGEYGSQTHRPHYHAIIYGLKLDQTKLKLYKHNEMGQSIWTHEELEKIWGKGFVTVGRVTFDSCAYVARYMMKKQYGENSWYYGSQGKVPEFINSSLKPAIGREYLEKNLENLYITNSITIAKNDATIITSLPKSYQEFIKQQDPEHYEKMKKKQKIIAESLERSRNLKTDLSPAEYRLKHCEALEEKTKALIREI